MAAESLRLDLLGFGCPIPVRETRRALRDLPNGAMLQVITDDIDSLHDIPALLTRLDFTLLSIEEEAGEYTFNILKSAVPSADAAERDGAETQ